MREYRINRPWQSRDQYNRFKDDPNSKGKSELRLQVEYKQKKFKDYSQVKRFIENSNREIEKAKQIILEQQQAIIKHTQDKVARQLCYEFRDHPAIHWKFISYLEQSYEMRQDNFENLKESIQDLQKTLQVSAQSIKKKGKDLQSALAGCSTFIGLTEYWPSKDKVEQALGNYGKALIDQRQSVTRMVETIAEHPEFIMRSKSKSLANLLGFNDHDTSYRNLLDTLLSSAEKARTFKNTFIPDGATNETFRVWLEASYQRYMDFDAIPHKMDLTGEQYDQLRLQYLDDTTIAESARKLQQVIEDTQETVNASQKKLVLQLSEVLEDDYHD